MAVAMQARDASMGAPPPPPPLPDNKPATDVVAGAVARAASQSTIHPLDTMKVRMQAGGLTGAAAAKCAQVSLHSAAREVASLYRGVLSAATGAGVIIGAYFAFYSTTKRELRRRTRLSDGQVAFVSGGVAAVGSSVVKVPIAVCIRSVQAGVYPNVVAAARSITKAAGPRGLFTGFLPTLSEDVPDMACKFAAYESMRGLHRSLLGGRAPAPAEDFAMGALAGAAAAAATTPLDVVKTRMMCAAASRPTMAGAAREVLAAGGPRALFSGVWPRAVSNGINSAVFFCFFEAIRGVLQRKQMEEEAARQAAAAAAAAGGGVGGAPRARHAARPAQLQAELAEQHSGRGGRARRARDDLAGAPAAGGGAAQRRGGARAADAARVPPVACLSLALPLPGGGCPRWW